MRYVIVVILNIRTGQKQYTSSRKLETYEYQAELIMSTFTDWVDSFPVVSECDQIIFYNFTINYVSGACWGSEC